MSSAAIFSNDKLRIRINQLNSIRLRNLRVLEFDSGRCPHKPYRLAKDKDLGLCELNCPPRISLQRGLRQECISDREQRTLPSAHTPLSLQSACRGSFLKNPPAVSARRRRFEKRASAIKGFLMCVLCSPSEHFEQNRLKN